MALLAGFAVGLFGAIPPGPVNFNVIRKASQNETREALRVALGAALVDTVICGFVAMGFGWVLEKVVNNPWTRLGLALFLLAGGLKILVFDRKRDAERDGARRRAHGAAEGGLRVPVPVPRRRPSGSGEPGALRELDAHHLLPRRAPDPPARPPRRPGSSPSASASASSPGSSILTELVERLKGHPAGEWIRNSTFAAGVLLLGLRPLLQLEDGRRVRRRATGFRRRPGRARFPISPGSRAATGRSSPPPRGRRRSSRGRAPPCGSPPAWPRATGAPR